jgi:hypothetical protein
MAACAKVAFPACTTPLITALGAFDEQRKFVLRLSEKRPPRLFLPYFQSAELLRLHCLPGLKSSQSPSKTNFPGQYGG